MGIILCNIIYYMLANKTKQNKKKLLKKGKLLTHLKTYLNVGN